MIYIDVRTMGDRGHSRWLLSAWQRLSGCQTLFPSSVLQPAGQPAQESADDFDARCPDCGEPMGTLGRCYGGLR